MSVPVDSLDDVTTESQGGSRANLSHRSAITIDCCLIDVPSVSHVEPGAMASSCIAGLGIVA